ncbi:hypothetical protein SDC9_198370 [bioreactor metagenome]|uniref:Uncharacterized protein n=1 Tax=bioreactor metagenome TaxID=1076179 RepID=A0A645IHH2_9ZZZZ
MRHERHYERHDEDKDRDPVQEHPEEEKEDIEHEQDEVLVLEQGEHKGSEFLRDALSGEEAGQNGPAREKKRCHSERADGARERVLQTIPC